jgi:hypothetical protein
MAGFLLGLLFDPEDGGDNLFRKVGLSPNYTTLQLLLVSYFPSFQIRKFAQFNYLLFVIAALVQLTVFRTLFEEAEDVFTLLGALQPPTMLAFFSSVE